jgi:hypothetical protein
VTQSNHRRYWLAFLLAYVVLFGFLTMPGRLYVEDPYTWREEARSIVISGTLHVEDAAAHGLGEPGQYFVQNTRNGLWYSKYGVMNGVLNAVPMFAERMFTGALPRWDAPSRRLYLNIFFVIVAALNAWVLFRIAENYTSSCAAIFFFLFFSFYCTFLWHYLRATNSESTQLLFFSAYFERLISYRRSDFRKPSALNWAWIFLLILVLTKVSFLLLVPVTVAIGAWPLYKKTKKIDFLVLIRALLPAFLLLAILGAVNWAKFGNPAYTGYHAWKTDIVAVSLKHTGAFYGLFFSEQWSLFTHFPLLLFALFGLKEFAKKFPFDTWLIFAIFLIFLFAIGSMPVWKGEWSYGPRYFLFLLPILSMPLVLILARFLHGRKAPGVYLLVSLLLIVCAYSEMLQFQIERLDPFFYYWTKPPLECVKDPEVAKYFSRTHYGRILHALRRHEADLENIWYVSEVRRDCSAKKYTAYVNNLKLWLSRKNFYWFEPAKN